MSASPSPTLPTLAQAQAALSPRPHDDARMLAQQQVRLLGGQSRLLRRLLRGLVWFELNPSERRRVLSLLSHLDSDMALALAIARRANGLQAHDESRIPF